MAKSELPTSPPSPESTPTSSPSVLPDTGIDIEKFQKSPEAAKLVAWVQEEWAKAKSARSKKQLQWFINMSMFYGEQWIEQTRGTMPSGFRDQLLVPKRPYYHQKKIINRTRAFVRWELSKFTASMPNMIAVPSSSEDQDQRAALAAEQVWSSVSDSKKLRQHLARAAWWIIVTGNGFIKTQWDPDCIDKVSGQPGDIKYSSITPFHLFVPDIREVDIEDQPFLINAYTKPVQWVYHYFAKELNGKTVTPSVASANQILEEGYLNLGSERKPDSVVVYETWVKPGATKLMPRGGVIISCDDILLRYYPEGMPYSHDEYPFAKFEHIPTATFYADSPLVDLNQLQKEYNTLRSEIGEAGKRMAKPQLLAPKGSIITSKLTNEPGLVIEYKPGLNPPQPLPLAPLPQYYVDQQDRVLQDWEDLSGEKEVLRGSAPSGVTAGTAINYLQEAANGFLAPQYDSLEFGMNKIATQTIGLFNQYVDVPRKIKTIGADGAFDTMLLQGSDIAEGTDIRVEKGSSINKSQAAQEAKVMDMFGLGIIDQPLALRLLQVGGAQKIADTMDVAEKKAQRENTKMKGLKPDDIMAAAEEQRAKVLEQLQASGDPEMLADPEVLEELENLPAPLLVAVDDFDVHEMHIETHNRFRMGQEYESLPPEVKAQFEQHVAEHQQFVQQEQLMGFLNQIPGDGSEEGGAPAGGDGMEVPVEGEAPVEEGLGATMSANGAVPAPPTATSEGAV